MCNDEEGFRFSPRRRNGIGRARSSGAALYYVTRQRSMKLLRNYAQAKPAGATRTEAVPVNVDKQGQRDRQRKRDVKRSNSARDGRKQQAQPDDAHAHEINGG